MSNQNVWKNNWNKQNHDNSPTDPNHTSSNYRSIRTTNRYTRYTNSNNSNDTTNNKPNTKPNSYQNILQRGKTNTTPPPKNNGYEHNPNTYHQNVLYNDIINDNQNDISYEYANKRLPINDGISDKRSSHIRKSKWKSQRVEKLKNTDSNTPPIDSSHSHTPITYKDTRFTKFTSQVDIEQTHTHTHTHTPPSVEQEQEQEQEQEDNEANDWYYKDPSGQEQGPFDTFQMSQWFNDGYFPQDLPIRCNDNTPFIQL
eukprot:68983_1